MRCNETPRGHRVVSGVRAGRIHHTDSTSTFSFRTQPIRFTLVAILYLVIGGTLLYVAFGRATAIGRD
jgi:hypothetical protein